MKERKLEAESLVVPLRDEYDQKRIGSSVLLDKLDYNCKSLIFLIYKLIYSYENHW